MPEKLSPGARAVWRRLAPELERYGLLTRLDSESFASLCETRSLMLEALDEMRPDKRKSPQVVVRDDSHQGRLSRHPALMAYQALEKSFLAWCREFGLTPSGRVGLAPGGGPPPIGDDDDDDDDLLD